MQAGLKEETADLIENLEGSTRIRPDAAPRVGSDGRGGASGWVISRPIKAQSAAARAAADRFKQLIESLKADAAAGGRWWRRWRRWWWRQAVGATAFRRPPSSRCSSHLQQEINDRTESLDEAKRRNKKLTPEQTAELKKIGDEQGVLADLVRDMTRPKRDDGEE